MVGRYWTAWKTGMTLLRVKEERSELPAIHNVSSYLKYLKPSLHNIRTQRPKNCIWITMKTRDITFLTP
jgi:hypothetical protein